jgi:hypothetical protein
MEEWKKRRALLERKERIRKLNDGKFGSTKIKDALAESVKKSVHSFSNSHKGESTD